MPVFTAIGAAIFGAGTFLAGATAFGLQMAAGYAISSLAQQALAKRAAPAAQVAPASPGYGVQGQLSSGGDVGDSILFGRCATSGSYVWANTWGNAGDTPNAYFTQVFCLSDIPVQSLDAVWVDGKRYVPDWDNPHVDFGAPLIDFASGGKQFCWVKFYDGTQTAADDFLINRVASDARPYESTRVGVGRAYAIMTARLTPKFFNGFPSYLFEMTGAKLYDISKDTTAGGSGSQVWGDPSTWGGDGDFLPAVQAYNVLRGIHYAGSWVYGIQNASAAMLPADNWIAQIGKCRAVTDGPDGDEPMYASGGEIFVSNEIAQTVEQLMLTCQGSISEIGGIYKMHCGEPDASVFSFDDDAILISKEGEFDPFFGLSEIVNAVSATYPEPADGWNNKVATPLLRPDLEPQAGGRRAFSDLSLDLVSSRRQAEQLMRESLQEAQRARRHTIPLPPEFIRAEPGDICTWTSPRWDYTAKVFRVGGVGHDDALNALLDITEIDPADWDYDLDEHHVPATLAATELVPVPAQEISDFAVESATVAGDDGALRPAIRVSWSVGDGDDIAAVAYEVRLASDGQVVLVDRTDSPADEELLISGASILPATNYEVRARFIPFSTRETEWSSWIAVTTPAVRLELPDLSDRTRELIATSQRRVEELRQLAAQLSADLAGQMLSGEVQVRNIRSDLAVERDGRRAAITEVQEVAILTDAALASLTLTVEAHTTTLGDHGTTLSSHTASIVTNASAIATLDSSLSSLTSTVSAQGTTIGGHTTTLATHTSDIAALVSADSAFSSSLTTLSTTVGGHTSTLSTHAASIDGLNAAYTITLDVNGYVSGYESVNDGATSEFTILASRFAVAAPGVTGGDPTLLFEVAETPDGDAVALIKGALQVDHIETPHVVDEAINSIASSMGSTATTIAGETSGGAGDGTQIHSITLTVSADGDGTVDVYFSGEFFFVKGTYTSTNKFTIGIYLDSATSPMTNSTAIWHATESDGDGIIKGTQSLSRVFTGLSAGSHTFKVKCIQTDWGSGSGSREIRSPYMRVMDIKR